MESKISDLKDDINSLNNKVDELDANIDNKANELINDISSELKTMTELIMNRIDNLEKNGVNLQKCIENKRMLKKQTKIFIIIVLIILLLSYIFAVSIFRSIGNRSY